jgi:hypothetical protein
MYSKVMPLGALRYIQAMWWLIRRAVCSVVFVPIIVRLKLMFALLSGAMRLLKIANA